MTFSVPTDPILTGLQNVMQYNAVTGNPELRVNIGGGIEINGTVNIPGIIQIQSSPEDPVDIHIRQVGTSGILNVPYLPVNVTNFPATQPVSIATLPSISGSVSITNFPATQPVSISSMPTTPVTGTFWQNTQPVSIASMPTTPVSGTFWQDTQPVSIANMPITQVTGTFWQATQPVSIASMPTTPVTGTFWPATQPVSGTVNIGNFPDPMPVSIASMPSTPVTGTFWPTIQPVSGTVTVQQGTSPWIISGNTTATVSGTVALDTATLAALENTTVTISGTPTVNIGTVPEVEVKNDSGNPLSVSANTTANSDSNPIYVKGTSDTSFFSPTQSDAFGRLRVSNPFTLFESFNRYHDNQLSSTYTAGSGSVSFNANAATKSLTVGSNSGDTVYEESNRVFAYQPGKSLLIMTTFTFNTAKANLTQRIGYFDTQNGYYLEQAGSTVNLVERSYVSGSLVETRKPQAQWNVNIIGSLDLTKSQIFWIDVEWLGVGTARMGFVINGEFIECHRWHHANIISGAYMTTACLPVRKEIFNTGTTSGSSTMLSICSTVISEGGYELHGRARSAGHPISTPVSLPLKETEYPLISLRLKSNMLNAISLPNDFTIGVASAGNYQFRIYRNAVSSGGTWIDAGSDTNVEYNLDPTGIVSGTVAEQSYIMASNQSSASLQAVGLPFKYQLERNSFTNTAYEFLITLSSSTTNSSAFAAITWEDIT